MQAEWRANAAGDDGPGHVDDAGGGVGQRGEGVWEEVEVVGPAAGALVYDHRLNRVPARPGNRDAGTTVAGIVPVGVRKGGAVDTRWERVGAEGAHAAANVAAIEGRLARIGAAEGGAGGRG